MNFIDFNEHIQEILYNEFGGSEKKRTIILDDGQKYMLKFPDPTREVNREISYINNAISEYIGCHIFEQTGFKAQNTILGTFTEKGKKKIACACKDMRENGCKLYETDKLSLESVDDTQNLTFDYVKKILHNTKGIDANSVFQEYCDRFIIDAFIGNTDRHNGNWGFIKKDNGLEISPVYDCGSSLSPLFSDDELSSEKILSNETFNVMSAVQDNDCKRIHYRDYLLSGKNENVNIALTKVVPKINLSKIHALIDDIPYISDVRKNFYKQILDTRYEKVLIPALENVLGIEKSDEYKLWNSKIINHIFSSYIEPLSSSTDLGTAVFPNQLDGSKTFSYVKNNATVFFMNADNICEGMASLNKSNLNICKLVQSLRKMGIDIDIDSIRKRLKMPIEEEKPSAIAAVEHIKAQQKNEPQKTAPVKYRNTNIGIDE